MRWTALQYGSVWQDVYDDCDKGTQELLDRRLDALLDKGNLCGRPISAPLGDGIFELRANQARMLYYFGETRQIIFVNCILKKGRVVPPEAIKLAKKRRIEIQIGKPANALPN